MALIGFFCPTVTDREWVYGRKNRKEKRMIGIISFVAFATIAVLGIILTKLNKRRMERGLGRKVDRLEANSISNWMEVAEKDEAKRS